MKTCRELYECMYPRTIRTDIHAVNEQILTNQLCILATLKSIGRDKLVSEQKKNIENRIKETKTIRDALKDSIQFGEYVEERVNKLKGE